MGLFTTLGHSDAVALGAEHGLDVVSVEPLEAGSVNSNFALRTRDGTKYFARIYEEQGVAGARAELTLLKELGAAGVPTVIPIGRSGKEGPATIFGKPFAIYPWAEGEILCQRRVTRQHCGAVGKALARLHLASGSLSALPPGRFGIADVEGRLDRIEGESVEYAPVARDLRERLKAYASRRDPDIPQGIIHGDLFRDNVLWRGDELVALIDFESASSGTFAFDLMVTLEAWCFSNAFVPELVESLMRGYHRTRRLEANEIVALPVEGAIAALRFATTRITDFAMRSPPGVAPKRDYRRFLARLEQIEGGALAAAFDSLER